VRGYAGPTAGEVGWDDPAAWTPLLPRTPVLPDTPHRFRVPPSAPCDVVRLDVLPDGGVARLRVHGSLTDAGLASLRERWEQTAF
jgi:allantoicase